MSLPKTLFAVWNEMKACIGPSGKRSCIYEIPRQQKQSMMDASDRICMTIGLMPAFHSFEALMSSMDQPTTKQSKEMMQHRSQSPGFNPHRWERFCFFCSGCGSVGRAVASVTRGPRFKSSHRLNVFTINSIEKTKIKKKRSGMAH